MCSSGKQDKLRIHAQVCTHFTSPLNFTLSQPQELQLNCEVQTKLFIQKRELTAFQKIDRGITILQMWFIA